MNKTRLEAFSDGVMAIIITIMVLEVKVPHGTSWQNLLELAPVLLSYVLSFIFVGIYWGNHHHLLHTVKRVTGGMIWANFNLLFWLSLIPFGTGWMGENHFERNTVIVYAALLILCGIAFTILQAVIIKTNPASEELAQAYKKMSRKGMISVFFYGLAIPAGFVNTAASIALFVIVSMIWIIPDRSIEKAVRD
ncbi:MAG: TMEM175 family protein [Flavitalea sp.]